jgi:hypothetical protein
MTNIYSLGGLETTAKITAFEAKANGLVKIGSVFTPKLHKKDGR